VSAEIITQSVMVTQYDLSLLAAQLTAHHDSLAIIEQRESQSICSTLDNSSEERSSIDSRFNCTDVRFLERHYAFVYLRFDIASDDS
jgi:hypothetical protein